MKIILSIGLFIAATYGTAQDHFVNTYLSEGETIGGEAPGPIFWVKSYTFISNDSLSFPFVEFGRQPLIMLKGDTLIFNKTGIDFRDGSDTLVAKKTLKYDAKKIANHKWIVNVGDSDNWKRARTYKFKASYYCGKLKSKADKKY